MSTNIRAKISEKNKYYIDKHRYYELKHFCLQYPIWKKEYDRLIDASVRSTSLINISSGEKNSVDMVSKNVINRIQYADKIEMIEKAAYKADSELHKFILKGITEELSYTYLKSRLDMPCSRDTYYDRYRKFFWYLNEMRK